MKAVGFAAILEQFSATQACRGPSRRGLRRACNVKGVHLTLSSWTANASAIKRRAACAYIGIRPGEGWSGSPQYHRGTVEALQGGGSVAVPTTPDGACQCRH